MLKGTVDNSAAKFLGNTEAHQRLTMIAYLTEKIKIDKEKRMAKRKEELISDKHTKHRRRDEWS